MIFICCENHVYINLFIYKYTILTIYGLFVKHDPKLLFHYIIFDFKKLQL
jgi:hypothetical protein